MVLSHQLGLEKDQRDELVKQAVLGCILYLLLALLLLMLLFAFRVYCVTKVAELAFTADDYYCLVLGSYCYSLKAAFIFFCLSFSFLRFF